MQAICLKKLENKLTLSRHLIALLGVNDIRIYTYSAYPLNRKRIVYLCFAVLLLIIYPDFAGVAFFFLGIGLIKQMLSADDLKPSGIVAGILSVICCWGISALLMISVFAATAIAASLPFLITSGAFLLSLLIIVLRCSIFNDANFNGGENFLELSPIFTFPSFKPLVVGELQFLLHQSSINNNNSNNEVQDNNSHQGGLAGTEKRYEAFKGRGQRLG